MRGSSTLLCLGFVLGLAPLAHAQATRTWVSGVGDDANPCSRTAPCKTFAGAISKTADGGFINVLDSGGFGAVTITKSITIDGEGTHAGVLAAAAGSGIIINAAGEEGHAAQPGDRESVGDRHRQPRHPRARRRGGPHREVLDRPLQQPCHRLPTRRAAPKASSTTSRRSATAAAPSAWSTGRVSVNRLDAYTNDAAVFVRGTAIATVRDSIAVGGSVGFGANTVPGAVLNVENSTITHNANGILVAAGATVRVSNSLIVSNVTFGLNNGGGGSVIISLSGNIVTGNPTDGAFSSTVIKQ